MRRLALLAVLLAGCAHAVTPRTSERLAWNGVAYGPHRDGQSPGGVSPTREQIREDLHLIAGRFDLVRLYGSVGPAEDVLAVIAEEKLPLRVLLGAWIGPDPGANDREVNAAARLARGYPAVVAGVCVGNETQVSWTANKVPRAELVRSIRAVREATVVPVCTADDFAYWLSPESDAVASEVDFLLAHYHPLWNGKTLGEALAATRETLAQVARRHPRRQVVLGETGWATDHAPTGDQGKLMKGVTGEDEARTLFETYVAWREREQVPAIWFEAFDENWKGGADPRDAEKHWGLWRADRTPKAAARGSDLTPGDRPRSAPR